MLHLPTVIGISLLLNVLISCLFFIAYRYKKQSYYLYLSGACAVFAAAEILASLRVVINSPFITHYLADLAIIAAPMLVVVGIAKVSSKKLIDQQQVATLFVISAITLLPIYTHSTGQLVTSMIIGGLFLYLAFGVLHLQSNTTIHQKILSACFLSHGFVMLYQAGLLASELYGYSGPVEAQTLNAILINHLILTTACSVLLPFIMFAKDESELQDLANRDSLSALLNRRGFFMKGEQLREEAIQQKIPLSIIMIDIDHFKSVNDTHGHGCGDEALRHIADLLRKTLRETDTAGRYGGEEFAVTLLDTDKEGAFIFAERLRTLIENSSVHCDNKQIKMTVSIGFAGFDKAFTSHEKWIEAADKALYFSKENGRNQVAAYSNIKEG